MITAYFRNRNLVIDISGMDEKYKVDGKKITFTLYYGTEYTGRNGEDSYSVEGVKEIIYSGESEVIIEVNEEKFGYNGNSIFIGYYINVNFGRKFLVFKDSKEIDIVGREGKIFNNKDLPQLSNYFHIDKYSFKKIISNLPVYKKVIAGILLISLISVIGLYIYQSNIETFSILSDEYYIFIGLFSFIGLIILFFMSGRGYFKGKLKENISDIDKLQTILRGRINLDLEELEIKIFAYNSEKGGYEVREGTTTRIVWFNKQVGGVLLYNKHLTDIRAGVNIEDLLDGDIDYNLIYERLFPNLKIKSNMGLFLNFEVQLISKNYKDIVLKQEICLDITKFRKNKVVSTNIDEQDNDNNFNSDFFG